MCRVADKEPDDETVESVLFGAGRDDVVAVRADQSAGLHGLVAEWLGKLRLDAN